MKKMPVIILSITLIMVFVFCIIMLICSNEEGVVFVDGKHIIDISLSEHPKDGYILIPVIATLRNLGYQVVSQESDYVCIEKDNKQFFVDLNEVSLREKDNNMNYFDIAPSSTYYYCNREDNDIIMDIDSFRSTLSLMEDNYYITDIPALKLIVFSRK